MANNYDSAATKKVADVIMDEFESSAVLINSVDTQLLNEEGISEPKYGGEIEFQRPMQWKTTETIDGNVSAEQPNDIIYGKTKGVVQDVITTWIEYNALDQAIRMRQLERHLKGIGDQIVATVEKNLGRFMLTNAGLTHGSVGTALNSWEDIMSSKAFYRSLGVKGEIDHVVNDYAMGKLASLQQGVANMPSSNVRSAWEMAQIPSRVAGVSVLSSDMLSNYQAGALAGGSGTLSATPTATYLSVKDTMVQSLTLTGLTASTANALRPGDVIEWTGTGAGARSYINMLTREVFHDESGAPVKFRQTVIEGGNTDASGVVTVKVTAPAIYETGGQYNNISAPLVSGDAFTILGTSNSILKPNLSFAKNAFGIGFAKLPKLYSTDTIIETKAGITMRVSKGVSFLHNKQMVRVDVVPAHICFNPMRAARNWG